MSEPNNTHSRIMTTSKGQESALSIHNKIIAAGGYPKSTQVIQQMLRKPEHKNHPADVNMDVLNILLKKGNLESALLSLGFEIENRKVIGLRRIAD
ncbi:hypothetical protein [Halomonas sp. BC04]|uniref:hypothetical protein n=1 Tax=Halomonas sp. BC04 TaxID=1403540 RepID=UPI0012DFAD4D|nr:hypothetical protein [Halomonas sp. BC04]